MLEETTLESGNRRETKRFEKKTNRGMKGTVNGHQIPTGSGKDRPKRAIPISADEEKSARTSTIGLQPLRRIGREKLNILGWSNLGGKPPTNFID